MLALIVIAVVGIFAVPTAIALAFVRSWPWFVVVTFAALAALLLLFPMGHTPIKSCAMASCDGMIVGNIFADLIRPWLWGTMALLFTGMGIRLARRKAR